MVRDFPNEAINDLIDIIVRDDKEMFLDIFSHYGNRVLCMSVVMNCARYHAKKCLLAMIEGEVGEPAQEMYARLVVVDPQTPTPLAYVTYYFHGAYDIIDLLFKQGAVEHVNTKCSVDNTSIYKCPLDLLLVALSYESHLHPWAQGNPVNKLVILLCQWETKPSLDSARLLAPHTDGINDIAWTYVKDGRLVSLAALLLVAYEKVLVPFDSGLTIRQRINDMADALGSEGDLGHEEAKYLSMLVDACKLLDIFERAGGALGLYCTLMHEYVPPDKVLHDVASVLKKAGFELQLLDLDLRDCYRGYPELWNASLFKLSDPPSPNKDYFLPSSLTRAKGLGAAIYNPPYAGDCQFLHKLKSGPMLNLVPSASMPRLLRTLAGQVDNGGSSFPRKHLAYIAFRLKRGIKF